MDDLYLPAKILSGDDRQLSLSAILEFDHVVLIEPMRDAGMFHVNTRPTGAPYAPEILDPDSNSTAIDMHPDWTLITSRLTGQYGYGGPWLHDSELIEGGVARRILEHVEETGGGYYVAVYATYTSEEENEDSFIEGWSIAYRAK